jgi:hypothetical protein
MGTGRPGRPTLDDPTWIAGLEPHGAGETAEGLALAHGVSLSANVLAPTRSARASPPVSDDSDHSDAVFFHSGLKSATPGGEFQTFQTIQTLFFPAPRPSPLADRSRFRL